MQPMDELDETIRTVSERIASYRGQGIGEQNTKVGLIAPILRSLGWNVEDLREVHLEYKRRPADKPVDYALMLNAAPRLFVEAKALDENLEDHRWANQIMGYAMVAGVRWVVLTNGDEYRIYNSHAAVPVEDKLFRKVGLSDDAISAAETLRLLSRESTAELEALWQEDFVDRRVEEAVGELLGPDPDDGLVRLLRKRLPPELSARSVRDALARLQFGPLHRPASTSTVMARHSPAKTTDTAAEKKTHGEGTPWSGVTLGDILSAGMLTPPVDLTRSYKGHDLRAQILGDGRVEFAGKVFGSLSIAGQMARRSITPQISAQTNGWTFWSFRDSEGHWRDLDSLRRSLWERRHT
jgi:hypothetical protein